MGVGAGGVPPTPTPTPPLGSGVGGTPPYARCEGMRMRLKFARGDGGSASESGFANLTFANCTSIPHAHARRGSAAKMHIFLWGGSIKFNLNKFSELSSEI